MRTFRFRSQMNPNAKIMTEGISFPKQENLYLREKIKMQQLQNQEEFLKQQGVFLPIETIILVEKNLFEMKFLCDDEKFFIVLRDPYTGKEALLPQVFPISALEEKISLGISKDAFLGKEHLLKDLYDYAREQLPPDEILSLEDSRLVSDLFSKRIH